MSKINKNGRRSRYLAVRKILRRDVSGTVIFSEPSQSGNIGQGFSRRNDEKISQYLVKRK
jgi:hypothetical protein